MIKNISDMERILRNCNSSNIYDVVSTYSHNYTYSKYELLTKMREASSSYMKFRFEEKYARYENLIGNYLELICSDEFCMYCKEDTSDKMNYNSICLLMDCYNAMIKLNSTKSSNKVKLDDNILYVNFNN